MKIIKAKDYLDMSKKAANIVAAQITLKSNSILGLATGSTPEGLYAELVSMYKNGDIDFSDITSFNLDEYKDLAPDHDQSYRYYMNKNLFDLVNIEKSNTNLPNGLENDSEKECIRYENAIDKSGGIDLQILGLGLNGHVGFNEPNSKFDKSTHCVKLTQSTLDANSRFFDNDISKMPHYAYTMGIGTIMKAKKILLVVNGKAKSNILFEALNGPITPEVPASILQLHKNLYVVADEEALSKFNI